MLVSRKEGALSPDQSVLKLNDNIWRTVFFRREARQNTIYFFDRTYTLTGTRSGSTSPCGVRTRQVRIRYPNFYFSAQMKIAAGFTCFTIAIESTFCACTARRVRPTKGNSVLILKKGSTNQCAFLQASTFASPDYSFSMSHFPGCKSFALDTSLRLYQAWSANRL